MSILLLLLMTLDLGAEYVGYKVLRVFTFGSPPVLELLDREDEPLRSHGDGGYYCPVLDMFELPSTIVEGYVQPWDPIVRLFTPYDALYPLVDDVGDDGYT